MSDYNFEDEGNRELKIAIAIVVVFIFVINVVFR